MSIIRYFSLITSMLVAFGGLYLIVIAGITPGTQIIESTLGGVLVALGLSIFVLLIMAREFPNGPNR